MMTWTDYGPVRVHHLDSGEHVVAVDGMWWPGVYASPDAARAAAGIDYERVAEIWAAILTRDGAEHAVIREDDLLAIHPPLHLARYRPPRRPPPGDIPASE